MVFWIIIWIVSFLSGAVWLDYNSNVFELFDDYFSRVAMDIGFKRPYYFYKSCYWQAQFAPFTLLYFTLVQRWEEVIDLYTDPCEFIGDIIIKSCAQLRGVHAWLRNVVPRDFRVAWLLRWLCSKDLVGCTRCTLSSRPCRVCFWKSPSKAPQPLLLVGYSRGLPPADWRNIF